MESIPSNAVQAPEVVSAESLEELAEWKVDSTFQHRVNNVCTKLLRKGIRPTYQRVKANMGESPARLLREALRRWTAKILPDLYAAPKVEWADRPKAISPRVAELFEEMWLQAVSAAQVHYELGDDSGARLTHRELVDTVTHELRRVNTRISSVANSVRLLEVGKAERLETLRDFLDDIRAFQDVLEMEISSFRELRARLDDTLSGLKRESEKQTALLSQQMDVCREIQRMERVRTARVRRLAKKVSTNTSTRRRSRSAERRRI
jgi:hypothetical protein